MGLGFRVEGHVGVYMGTRWGGQGIKRGFADSGVRGFGGVVQGYEAVGSPRLEAYSAWELWGSSGLRVRL